MSAVIKLSSPATREYWELPVLFEDESLMALDKPAGLLTSPSRYDLLRTSLMGLLHAGIDDAKSWAQERQLGYLMNVHRLEAEASGVLLLARSRSLLVRLADWFGADTSAVEYIVLAQGAPTESRFEIEVRLAPHPTAPGMVRVDTRRGKRSLIRVEVLETFSGYCLLKCRPQPDRHHGIRVCLRYRGLPVVADAAYGGKPLLLSRLKPGYQPKKNEPERPLIGRAALHAAQLALPHPVTGQLFAIAAPWPKDLTVAVKYLRKFKPPGRNAKA